MNNLDLIDSRVEIFEREYKTMTAGEVSAKKVFGLDTHIYKPTYMRDNGKADESDDTQLQGE